MQICTPTIHAANVRAGHGRTVLEAPLALPDRARLRRRHLTAACPGGPVMREAAGADTRAAELRAVREALADPRPVQDRVMDVVLDRLMCELGG